MCWIPPTGGKFFIDIATLSTVTRGFFTEDWDTGKPGGGNSIAASIRELLQRLRSNTSVTPVIRFLVGLDALTGENQQTTQQMCDEIFFPGGKPLIEYDKAELYIGGYGPNFDHL